MYIVKVNGRDVLHYGTRVNFCEEPYNKLVFGKLVNFNILLKKIKILKKA